MKLRKTNPRAEAANECTDTTGPPLLMKTPNSASKTAMSMSAMFHILNMPRRRCTIMEWMKAVSASHGISATFSIGSQLQ